MRLKYNLFLTSALLFCFFSSLVFSGDEEFRFVKKAHVNKETDLQTSLITFRGDIRIDGILKGSVIQIGGRLEINGHITSDVIAIGTDVELLENANVDGEFLLVGGKLKRHEAAKIKGEFFFFKINSKHFESSVLPVFLGDHAVTLLKLIKIILWLLLTLIIYSMTPERIHAMSILLKPDNWGRIFLNGIITTSIGIVLLVVFIILSFVIIGIPLLLLLAILGFIFLVISRTVMFYTYGGAIAQVLKVKIKPLYRLVFGTILYAILKFIPFIGAPILISTDLVGVGLITVHFFRYRKTKV